MDAEHGGLPVWPGDEARRSEPQGPVHRLVPRAPCAAFHSHPRSREAAVYFGVIHTIRDGSRWEQMLETADLGTLPEGVELMSTCTSTDNARALCLWRVPSREVLEGVLDQLVGDNAINDVFEVTEGSVIVGGQPAAV